MKFLDKLAYCEQKNQSMLCIGLDPNISKLPYHLRGKKDIFTFLSAIIDATHDLVMAYKPQIAYFSALNAENDLLRIIEHIRKVSPKTPIILDAKRGDIGSTAEQYAKEAFERYGADSVTLSPYMGFDSVAPYLKYPDCGVFLLCRTSNPGGDDLQNRVLQDTPNQPKLFEYVAQLASQSWNKNGQMGLVVGATYPEEIAQVRSIAPTMPLLIPGIGAQGGDPVATVKNGWRGNNKESTGTICVNSSRTILFASSELDFAQKAREAALTIKNELWAARTSTP